MHQRVTHFIIIMKLIAVLFALLALVYADAINSLSVISPLDLMRKQGKPSKQNITQPSK